MQSGISASADLQSAFNALVSDPSQRAVLATIGSEAIRPLATIPAHSDDFARDLTALAPHLTLDRALYILLKLDPAAPDGYAAITYVPNAAPVRQKMLFASTRLTLARELGLERFRQQIFCTLPDELTREGWARHEEHTALDAPLTEEESGLRGVREAEAKESMGTGGRRGHVSAQVNLRTGDGVLEALGSLREAGCRGTLVQIRYQLPDEILTLESSTDGVRPADVGSHISASEARYSFYSAPSEPAGAEDPPEILFIYTCPSGSKIKERMIYSTSKNWMKTVAERDAGIVVARSLEATGPAELTAEALGLDSQASSARESGTSTPASTSASGFARPKRPGRR